MINKGTPMNRIKQLRIASGHESQREFARFMSSYMNTPVSFGTISKLESQKEDNPKWKLLDAMATYFNVSVDYLMGRTNVNFTDKDAEHDPVDDLPVEARLAIETFTNNMRKMYKETQNKE